VINWRAFVGPDWREKNEKKKIEPQMRTRPLQEGRVFVSEESWRACGSKEATPINQ